MNKRKFIILFITITTCFSYPLASHQPTTENLDDKINLLQKTVRAYVPQNAVIAHRGTTYWAPEATEAAYRWARNIGADYLEADLQLTKDGKILTLHDTNLTRTTNIKDVYPSRQKDPTHTFTYQELLKLDAGSWFNKKFPERARKNFEKLEILTLEDVIKIAEGYKIKRDPEGKRIINSDGSFAYIKDEMDNGNRPGIYLELKEPQLNPGIEKKLEQELNRLGWNILKKPENSNPFYLNGKVNVGNTNGKLILQTFSENSLMKIQSLFKGKIPTTLLIEWYDGGMIKNSPNQRLQEKIQFAIQHQVHFIGPSIQNYSGLTKKSSQNRKNLSTYIHSKGLGIHPYSFDTSQQIEEWENLIDGMFTNRSDLSVKFYSSQKMLDKQIISDSENVLLKLGY